MPSLPPPHTAWTLPLPTHSSPPLSPKHTRTHTQTCTHARTHARTRARAHARVPLSERADGGGRRRSGGAFHRLCVPCLAAVRLLSAIDAADVGRAVRAVAARPPTAKVRLLWPRDATGRATPQTRLSGMPLAAR
jgi:hypothetical protein